MIEISTDRHLNFSPDRVKKQRSFLDQGKELMTPQPLDFAKRVKLVNKRESA